MMIKDLKELIVTLDKSSVQHFEMENAEVKLKISKNQGVVMQSVEPQFAHAQEKKVAQSIEVEASTVFDDPSVEVIQSPMVGVYYEASSPESVPFVKTGAVVKQGQPLCIIEAMKIMNEIEAEFEGEVVEILVQNEDVVEYGQPLMRIRRA